MYPLPNRGAALACLANLGAAAYARTRNHLEGDVTGLSPYLTHGLLTLPEVLANVLEREPLALNHKFVQELGWREFFRHVWSHAGSGIFQSLHAGALEEDAYSSHLPADIREGRTGVYHRAWPWPKARWNWVDAAMAKVTGQRWIIDAPTLAAVLAGAASVRTVDDPHITPWLKPIARLEAAPTIFPSVEQSCRSFSQWWNRATHALKQAEDLL